LEDIAELVTLPGSSLALFATLWSVSSGSRLSATASGDPSDASPSQAGIAQPGWAGFVSGIDGALEQSRSEARDAVECGRPFSSSANSSREGGDQIPDQWPLVTSLGRNLVKLRTASLQTRLAAPSEAPRSAHDASASSSRSTKRELIHRTRPTRLSIGGLDRARLIAAWCVSLLSLTASAFLTGMGRTPQWAWRVLNGRARAEREAAKRAHRLDARVQELRIE
jgi:hypothetical protein